MRDAIFDHHREKTTLQIPAFPQEQHLFPLSHSFSLPKSPSMQSFNERYSLGAPPATTSYSLQTVRKPTPKPWRKSAALPKVYKVEPRGFRQLVQRLTGASPPAGRLSDAAPAPLTLPHARERPPQWAGKSSPSPYSPFQALLNLPLLSPNSIAFLDQTTVL